MGNSSPFHDDGQPFIPLLVILAVIPNLVPQDYRQNRTRGPFRQSIEDFGFITHLLVHACY